MQSKSISRFVKLQRVVAVPAALIGVCLALLILAHCSSNSNSSSAMGFGSATVTISDPPSCLGPQSNLQSVFITIDSVQAHISGTADDNSPGWQELAPQLKSQPVQVDLLHLPKSGGCLLQQLGSTSSLPVGDYQQIRLMLEPNEAPSGSVPASNACASLGQVFNCVEDSNGNFSTLDLSSQANTGLKIPPGQVEGGPIHVAAGQSVDINIDFNACASVVAEGPGAFRLKPTLTAEQISVNNTGISGKVIDSKTLQPIPGALVALEQADNSGIDRIFMEASTDSSGSFRFCPLPTGATFDVVTDAVTSSGLGYDATIVVGVPGGTALSGIKLVAETGVATGPGTIQGLVTAVNGTTGANIDAAMSAFQTVSLSGGGSREFTVPLEHTSSQSSTVTVAVMSATPCQGSSPTGAFCGQYTLIVPASNPSLGTLSSGTLSFAPPAASDVLYKVEAKATAAKSGGGSICSPSTETSPPLKVTPGTVTAAPELDFKGCM